ncbi:MAG: hypothetical protein R3251_00825 [Candidatus Spechtbacterales bacterium]|nr:hypothetical protein [Candidatus Spechtbacterales bacterium]
MHTHVFNINKKLLMFTAFFIAIFLVWSPSANASIVVEGDLEFRDEINDCLNTYRDVPGIVGDAIKELEESEHEHKIINSPSWNNSPNDVDEATGGSGSGTVTRVDKDRLEELIEQIEELENKDFCTALLHELYHALDADRGTRTSHDVRIDGVKRNEVEATLFQNFIHAIRGVPPRTHYGDDISEHVVIGDEEAAEVNDIESQILIEVDEDEPEADTETEEEEQPQSPQQEEEESDQITEEEEQAPAEVGMSFEHVVPGEYSEVYVTIQTSPGANVEATLSGPGVDSQATQTSTADGSGVARFTWRIISFGTYTVSGNASGAKFSSSVSVQ